MSTGPHAAHYNPSLNSAGPGTVVLTAQEAVWVIELHNGQDSRLTTRMIDEALRPALDVVEHCWHVARDKYANDNKGAGALVIVGRRDQDKFFSNGFDYETVKGNLSFVDSMYNGIMFDEALTHSQQTQRIRYSRVSSHTRVRDRIESWRVLELICFVSPDHSSDQWPRIRSWDDAIPFL